MEKTGVPAATVCPGSTLRMLMLPEIGASEPRVAQPLSFLARLGVCRVCLCGGSGAIFLPRPFLRHVIALPRGVVRRLELLKVVRRKALSFHQELHALVFVFRAFEVDAGLFQFLFPEAGVGLLRDGQRRFLLRRRRVERIAVIGRFDFRQQLSFAHMLALFDQHPGHLATDQESHVGRFRTFDRTTGAHRFGPLHNGWSSDLNRHGRLVGSRLGFCSHDVSSVRHASTIRERKRSSSALQSS